MSDAALPYFLYSFGILFREGLEAILVVVALAAGTHQIQGRDGARSVYAGAFIALALSLILAWAINSLITDDTSDTLEGAFQMLAAATLLYVSSWLTAKSQSDRWRGFIESQVQGARRSAVPALALGLTSFMAVMREGGETIVFFQALVAGTTERLETHAVIGGIAAGSVALAVSFLVLRRAARRINLSSFFWATSILLYAMAIIFVGQGVASWQEAGVLGATFIDYVPTIPSLGLFPTAQGLGAQLVLMLFASGALLAPRGFALKPHLGADSQAPSQARSA